MKTLCTTRTLSLCRMHKLALLNGINSQDHVQTAPAVPSITRAPTGQANLARIPTGQGNLTRQPTGPVPMPQDIPTHPHTDPTISHDLHPAYAGSQQATHPQPPQSHSQFAPGTPSTGHFGLLPLQIARSAGDAVRTAPMLRSASRTPQPTTALSVPQSSAAQQVGAQAQRRISTDGAPPSQQGQQPNQQAQQQPGSSR